MISKSISTSTRLSEVSEFAQLLFTWIIPHCDDYGHLDANPKIVKAIVLPLSERTVEDVKMALEEIQEKRLIKVYESDGRKYIEVEKWNDHQTLKSDRPLHQHAPLPEDEWNNLDSKRKPVGNSRKNKLSESKGSESKGSEDPRASMQYLREVPKEDVKEFMDRFGASEKVIRSKAEDLLLYCERKGVKYKNYRSFLLNALKRDLATEGTKAGGKYESVGKKVTPKP